MNNEQRSSASVLLPERAEIAGGEVDRLTYELFVAQVTFLALLNVSALLFLPFREEIDQILARVDSLICIILILDFVVRLRHNTNRIRYLFGWGLLDLAGSIPGFILLRYLRLPLLFMQVRLLRRQTPAQVLQNARRNLAQSTLLAVSLLVLLVVTFGSIGMVVVESRAPNATIITGNDAIWWSIVTVATVGYGDTYPVTSLGRFIGVFTIVVGVGLFSVTTSYISSIFLNRGSRFDHERFRSMATELAEVKKLLEEIREEQRTGGADSVGSGKSSAAEFDAMEPPS